MSGTKQVTAQEIAQAKTRYEVARRVWERKGDIADAVQRARWLGWEMEYFETEAVREEKDAAAELGRCRADYQRALGEKL